MKRNLFLCWLNSVCPPQHVPPPTWPPLTFHNPPGPPESPQKAFPSPNFSPGTHRSTPTTSLTPQHAAPPVHPPHPPSLPPLTTFTKGLLGPALGPSYASLGRGKGAESDLWVLCEKFGLGKAFWGDSGGPGGLWKVKGGQVGGGWWMIGW